jgi:hypothetical protein
VRAESCRSFTKSGENAILELKNVQNIARSKRFLSDCEIRSKGSNRAPLPTKTR